MVKIFPPPGSEHIVVDVLESMKGPISANTDCIDCSVSIEEGESGAVCYTERWHTREALDRHLGSPLFSRVLAAMELSQFPPEVIFYEVTGVGGLELVEKVRIRH